jgi:hypothetical protein
MQMTDKCRCIGDLERGNFVPNGNIGGGSVMIWGAISMQGHTEINFTFVCFFILKLIYFNFRCFFFFFIYAFSLATHFV